MREKLRGYKVFREVLTNTSKLYYARRFSRRYVIKEYANYRFLSEENRKDASMSLLEVDRRAQAFLEHLRRVFKLMRRGCRTNGLLNIPLDVFRQDVRIYKVTRMVDTCDIEPFQLRSHTTRQQMDIFLKTVLVQLDLLRRMRFVHGDIKPENVLVTGREKCYSAVVIDYEGGLVLGSGWDGHNIEYTPEYASPEMLAFQSARSSGTEAEIQAAYQKLDCAADIYSAGCVFASILTGTIPGWRGENGPLIVAAELLKGHVPLWLPKFHPFWRMLVKAMLQYDPAERPTADELLDALQVGEDAGLMKQLELPFQALEGYVFGETPAESFGGQQMRVGRERAGYEPYAVWHLDNAWTVEQPKVPILERQRAAAQRRRDYIAAVLEKLGGAPPASVPLPQGELVLLEALCFLAQPLPEGDRLTIEAFAKDPCSRPDAKRIMLELLDLVDRLHSAGLLSCAMTKEDVWIVKDSGGAAHPLLARPQRFLLMEQIPEPEDLDIPADILAPELCMYLGCQNTEDRQAVAKMIGTWSDIFSLGLIYHLLLCGELPAMAAPEYIYPGLAVQEDETGENGLLFHGELSAAQQAILRSMTAFEPEERIGTCSMAAAMIREGEPAGEPEPVVQKAPPPRKKKAAYRWRAVSEEEFGNLIDLAEEIDEPEGSGTVYLDENDVEEAPLDLESEDIPEPDTDPVLREFRGEKWYIWEDSETGKDKLIRRSLGLEAGKAALPAIHQLAHANGTLLDIERRFRLEESWYAATNVPPEMSRCLADQEGGITPEEADEILLSMLLAVETLHGNDMVCAVIRPEDILITPDGVRFDPYENGLFLDSPDAEIRWADRVRRDRRHFEQLRKWMAPELRSALESDCVNIPKKCDLYSLGLLYHWLLLGSLPDRRKLHLASLDCAITFGRRWLLSQMLSKKRITTGGAITMVRQLVDLQGVTHTFGAGRIWGEKAALYARAYGREIFVTEAETDDSGSLTCCGGLPELEYFIRCEGETVECPIRSGDRGWLSPGTFAKKR